MNIYLKYLEKYLNKGFARCFYGTCPNCKKKLFSVGEDIIDNKIKARFICDECGKKWKETVYPVKRTDGVIGYKYNQALLEIIEGRKKSEDFYVLNLNGKYYYYIEDDKLKRMSRNEFSKRKVNAK